MRDIKFFNDCFYKTAILRARRCKKDNNKPKSITVNYHVKRMDGLLVTVCRKTFLNIILMKKDRV
nr:unnamed protein product [Callosobruchus analis]